MLTHSTAAMTKTLSLRIELEKYDSFTRKKRKVKMLYNRSLYINGMAVLCNSSFWIDNDKITRQHLII